MAFPEIGDTVAIKWKQKAEEEEDFGRLLCLSFKSNRSAGL